MSTGRPGPCTGQKSGLSPNLVALASSASGLLTALAETDRKQHTESCQQRDCVYIRVSKILSFYRPTMCKKSVRE